MARPALVLKSDDPSEIPRKMRRRPSSQDWMDVVSWSFHDFVPSSYSSEGNKLSGVKLEQLEANMSAVSLQVTPEWPDTKTHITSVVG